MRNGRGRILVCRLAASCVDGKCVQLFGVREESSRVTRIHQGGGTRIRFAERVIGVKA